MNRLGFTPRESESLEQALALYQDPRMQCTGIFTHFAVADELDEGSRAHTREQFRLFMGFCGDLEHRGVKLGLRHCCNSAATLLYPEMHLDMVRCGIITYGLAPSPELRGLAPLRPILSLYARVVQLRELPAGEGVSYGRIFVTPSPRLIATVPIGYADGYQRQLGGIATALVRGVAVPVVGRVCMDQMMLDVTQVPGVQEGDRVTLVGTDGARSVTFEQLAELTGTIHYERVCALSLRVPRFYLRDGRILSSSEGHSQQS